MKDVTPVSQQQKPTVNEDLRAKSPRRKVKFFTAGNMAVMGILSAIAYVLYLLPKLIPVFNLPIFPSWLDLQISDLPALLGGFAIGPWASVIIIVIKCVLKMPLTSTACVGELADILVGIAFVLPASLLYKFVKKRKGALLGMLVGTVSATVVSILANWLILIPFFAMTFGNGDSAAGMNNIVGAVSVLYDGVTVDNFYAYYIPFAVIPFNLLRCIICSVITFLIYKPLSKALHWEIKGRKKSVEESDEQFVAPEQSVTDAAPSTEDTHSSTEQ